MKSFCPSFWYYLIVLHRVAPAMWHSFYSCPEDLVKLFYFPEEFFPDLAGAVFLAMLGLRLPCHLSARPLRSPQWKVILTPRVWHCLNSLHRTIAVCFLFLCLPSDHKVDHACLRIITCQASYKYLFKTLMLGRIIRQVGWQNENIRHFLVLKNPIVILNSILYSCPIQTHFRWTIVMKENNLELQV